MIFKGPFTSAAGACLKQWRPAGKKQVQSCSLYDVASCLIGSELRPPDTFHLQSQAGPSHVRTTCNPGKDSRLKAKQNTVRQI